MRGFFHLQSPQDLLHKLERDYIKLRQNPADLDLAFNLFVTAEHLPDWLARTGPQLLKGQSINAFKKAHPFTRICAHLANDGKHLGGDHRPAAPRRPVQIGAVQSSADPPPSALTRPRLSAGICGFLMVLRQRIEAVAKARGHAPSKVVQEALWRWINGEEGE